MAKQDPEQNLPAEKEEVGELAEPRISLQFREYLLREANDEERQKERVREITNRQLDKILSATDDDEIFDADLGGTWSSKDLWPLDMTLLPGLSLAKSWDRFNAPLGVYMQFSAIALEAKPDLAIGAGSELLVSTGAPLLIGKFCTWQNNGRLPRDVRLWGTTSQNGDVLRFIRIPAKAPAA